MKSLHKGWTIEATARVVDGGFEARGVASRVRDVDEDAGGHTYTFNRLGQHPTRDAADSAALLWVSQWMDENT